MRDSTVGTRFKTEKCYDEAQMRDYLVARHENKRDIDRVRNICSPRPGSIAAASDPSRPAPQGLYLATACRL